MITSTCATSAPATTQTTPGAILERSQTALSSRMFQIGADSALLITAKGLTAGDFISIVRVDVTSTPGVAAHGGCCTSVAEVVTLIDGAAPTNYALTPCASRAAISEPGVYYAVLLAPTAAGGIELVTTPITVEQAVSFRQVCNCPPEVRATDANGLLQLNVPPGYVAQVTAVAPPDTAVNAMTAVDGALLPVTDADDCCVCAANVDTTPVAPVSMLIDAPGPYTITTFPARADMRVLVTLRCACGC
jgi:hypothetical protein